MSLPVTTDLIALVAFMLNYFLPNRHSPNAVDVRASLNAAIIPHAPSSAGQSFDSISRETSLITDESQKRI